MRRGHELEQITVRLFEDDIEKLRQLANARREKWQVLLRLLVHHSLRKEKANPPEIR